MHFLNRIQRNFAFGAAVTRATCRRAQRIALFAVLVPLLSPIAEAQAYKVRRECETVQKSFGPYDACRTVFVVPGVGEKGYAELYLERKEEEKRLTTDCIKSKMEQEAMSPEKRSPPTATCETMLRRANGKTWTSF